MQKGVGSGWLADGCTITSLIHARYLTHLSRLIRTTTPVLETLVL